MVFFKQQMIMHFPSFTSKRKYDRIKKHINKENKTELLISLSNDIKRREDKQI